MNISKMIDAQRELDNHIRQEKRLENVNLIANTFVALQVELAEFANEGRWFKHWSENKEPRTKVEVTKCCLNCRGTGERSGNRCFKCHGHGELVDFIKNPLLEEFVDGVHFFLSIAIQKGWEESLYIHQEAILDLERNGLDGGLTGIYLELMFFLNMSHQRANKMIFGKPADEYYFSTAWFLFIGMGMVGFGFTEDQIEQAYFAKNKINHQRQESGY